ncbi:MAG: AAA family ATPase [Lewinellaceae bacterium]|nr:AAA family ATPase [Lewinellaceae bacterium]
MDHFRISRLEVNNIGPFGHLEMDFPEKPADLTDRAEVHILTGENGTGKTTILEMLVLGVELNRSRPFSSNKFRSSDKSSNVKIEFGAQGGSYQFHRNMDPLMSTFDPDHFASSFRDYHFAQGKPYSVAFFAYSGYRQIQHIRIKGIEEIKEHPFSDALSFKASINPKAILQWIANTITKEALAKNQSDPIAANRFRTAISNLEEIISQIIEKPIRFYLKFEPLNVIIEVDKEPLDFNLLPDGLKSIVSG